MTIRTPLKFRSAIPADATECVAIRGQTRENAISTERLTAIGITEQTWAEDIRSGALPGHVCLSKGKIVGYCFGAVATGEVVVVALLPEFEGRGIGRRLLKLVLRDLMEHGHRRLFLGCSKDPSARSYGFYRHLGWRPTGRSDKLGDEILELDVAPGPSSAGSA